MTMSSMMLYESDGVTVSIQQCCLMRIFGLFSGMSPSPWIHDSDEEEAPDGDSKPSKALLDEFW